MNKRRVDNWIPVAYEALERAKIAIDGKVDKNFRGQISTFGAAVVMGSLKAATAFFAQQGNAQVQREKLLQAMYYVVSSENGEPRLIQPEGVFRYICQNDNTVTREAFIDAAIALKLAMNLYDLGMGKGGNQ